MRQGGNDMRRRLSAALLATLLLASALIAFSGTNSMAADGEPRKVMLELITATWCVTCPYADEAADELSREYGPERFTVLQYHVSLDGLDTIETNERRDDYNAGQTGLPAAWFDGTEGIHSVGEPNTEFFYDLYKDAIDDGLKITSPISISAAITEQSNEFTVTASFGKSENIIIPDVVHARYVLFENSVQYPAGGVFYNYVVRDVEIRDFDYEALPYNEQVTFGIQGGWEPSNMGVAVYVQADTNGEVLQSASAVLGPKPTVTITTEIEGKEISSTTKIEGSATGDVQWVMVRIDGERYETADGTSSWSYEIDPSQLSDGTHALEVRAYSSSLIPSDAAGAEFASKSDSLLYMLLVLIIVIVVLLLAVILLKRKRREE